MDDFSRSVIFMKRAEKDIFARALPRRAGFTLVELLVVIAIIGMLMALLLPAVQQARESARIVQCSNKIKQMALACLNVDTNLGALPSGGWYWSWVGDPDRGIGQDQPGSWSYQILTFLEQDALFQLGHDNEPDNVTAAQRQGAYQCNQTALSVFQCPSRRIPQVYPATGGTCGESNCSSDSSGNAGLMTQGIKGDYAACWGDTTTTPEAQTGNPTSLSEASGFTVRDWDNGQGNTSGSIFRHSAVTPGEIRDGASNTYLIGEKYLCPDYYETGTCGADNETFYCGADNDSHRSTYHDPNSYWGLPIQDRLGLGYAACVGSAHSSTFGLSMCDGSTHRITYGIDPEVNRYLGNRGDDQTVRLPD